MSDREFKRPRLTPQAATPSGLNLNLSTIRPATRTHGATAAVASPMFDMSHMAPHRTPSVQGDHTNSEGERGSGNLTLPLFGKAAATVANAADGGSVNSNQSLNASALSHSQLQLQHALRQSQLQRMQRRVQDATENERRLREEAENCRREALSEKKKLRTRIAQLEAQLRVGESQHEDALSQLRHQILDLQRDCQRSKEEAQHSEEEWNRERQTLLQRTHTLQSEVQSLRSDLSQSQLNASVSMSDQDSTEKNEIVTRMQTALRERNSEVQQLRERVQQLTTEIEEATAALSSGEDAAALCKVFRRQLDEQERELCRSRNAAHDLAESRQRQERLAAQAATLPVLRAQIQLLERKLHEHARHEATRAQRRRKLRDMCDVVTRAIGTTGGTTDGTADGITGDTTGDTNESEDTLVATLSDRINALVRLFGDTAAQRKQSSVQQLFGEQELQALRREREQLRLEHSQVQAEVQELRQQVRAEQEKYAAQQQQSLSLSTVATAVDSLLSQLAMRAADVEEAERMPLEKVVQETQKQVKLLQTQADEERRRNEEQSMQSRSLTSQLQFARQQCADLKQQCLSLRQQLQQALQQVEDSIVLDTSGDLEAAPSMTPPSDGSSDEQRRRIDSLAQQLAEAERARVDAVTSRNRLAEVFKAETAKFRDGLAQLLGWRVRLRGDVFVLRPQVQLARHPSDELRLRVPPASAFRQRELGSSGQSSQTLGQGHFPVQGQGQGQGQTQAQAQGQGIELIETPFAQRLDEAALRPLRHEDNVRVNKGFPCFFASLIRRLQEETAAEHASLNAPFQTPSRRSI